MEFAFILAAVVTLDIVALELIGSGSRPLAHHDRALEALRRGDLPTYRSEMDELEREIARAGGPTF